MAIKSKKIPLDYLIVFSSRDEAIRFADMCTKDGWTLRLPNMSLQRDSTQYFLAYDLYDEADAHRYAGMKFRDVFYMCTVRRPVARYLYTRIK